MTTVATFLMFTGQAEEAMTFYAGLFPGAAVRELRRHGDEGPGEAGKVMFATLDLPGQRLHLFDSPPVHDFGFTPAISMFVACDGADEADRLFAALGEGGQVMMPLDRYPFAERFGWVSDRFGVSWQLSYSPAA